MSRFYRLKIYAAPFLAAATLMAPARGNDEIRRSPYIEEAARERISGERMFRLTPQQQRTAGEFPTGKPSDLERRNKLYLDSKQVIDNYCHTNYIEGIAVCVSLSGQQKMLYSAGIQDENLEVKATPDLVGNISFLSKTFLMYVLLKLAPMLDLDLSAGSGHTIQEVLPMDPQPVAQPIIDREIEFDNAQTQNIIFPLFDHDIPEDRELEYDTVKERDLNLMNWNHEEVRYTESDQLESITIEQVMYECSGVIQCLRWSVKNTKDLITLHEKVGLIAASPLMYQPGEMDYRTGIVQYPGWDLCNFELLAYIIETLSGRSYQDVMKDELVKLGLRNTTFQEEKELYLNKTRGSQIECINATNQYDDHDQKRATWVNYASHVGSEGLCSTVKDLDKFFNIMHVSFMTAHPVINDTINSMIRPRPGVASYLSDQTDYKMGMVRGNFGKGIVSEALLDEHPDANGGEVYIQSIIHQKGEAREGSSIAMLFTQVDPRNATPKSFSQVEKVELHRLRQTPVSKCDYEVRANSDMLTRETNSSEFRIATLNKYATVSIISTSRDKDLYMLGRQLAKKIFDIYQV